jgi:hypothetical protein
MLRSIAIVATILLVAGCFGSPLARAQGHPIYLASVSFPFYVDDSLLPAGTYQIVEPYQNVLRFQNIHGLQNAFLVVYAKEEGRRSPIGQLTFSRYGDSYFLKEFSAPDNSSEPHISRMCSRGRTERHAAAKVAGESGQEVAFITVPVR